MSKTSTGAKPTGGRPRKYDKSASLSLRADATQLEELKAFARWRSWKENVALSLSQVVFDLLKSSPAYRRFKADREQPAK